MSGAKVAGALATGGFSLLATGIRKKGDSPTAKCSSCGYVVQEINPPPKGSADNDRGALMRSVAEHSSEFRTHALTALMNTEKAWNLTVDSDEWALLQVLVNFHKDREDNAVVVLYVDVSDEVTSHDREAAVSLGFLIDDDEISCSTMVEFPRSAEGADALAHLLQKIIEDVFPSSNEFTVELVELEDAFMADESPFGSEQVASHPDDLNSIIDLISIVEALDLSARELIAKSEEWSLEEVLQALELERNGKRRPLVIKHLSELGEVSANTSLQAETSPPVIKEPEMKYFDNAYERENQKSLRRKSGPVQVRCLYCGEYTLTDASILLRIAGDKSLARQDRARETMVRGASMSLSRKKQQSAELMRMSMQMERQAAHAGVDCRGCGVRLA